jgi:Skp family chaperone for outer membrane proteins
MKPSRLVPLAFAAALTVALPVLAQPRGLFAIGKVKARVAVVDVDRCVGESEDGLRAKAALAKARLRRDSLLFAMEDALKAKEQRLQEAMAAQQKAGATAPDPKLQALAMEYQRDMQDYQLASKQAQSDLAAYEDQLFLPIEKKVKAIFQRLAEAQGFDLLVDRRSMPMTLKPELDLTEQVIREYNWGAVAPAASASASTKK